MKHTLRIKPLQITTLTAALLGALALGASQAYAQAAAPAAPAAAPAAAAPQAQEGPEATIKRAVDGVTSTINADRSIQSGDRSRITALVDTKIVPFVDPDAMTRSAVGPNWTKATPEQRSALIHEFKTLLTNTYAGAFTSYRPDTQISYKPTRIDGDAAVVRSSVKTSGTDEIPIDYYLEKQNGVWKVTDLSVYNARLVELYKSQFNAAIAAGGVDGLIRDLKAKNATGAARAKS